VARVAWRVFITVGQLNQNPENEVFQHASPGGWEFTARRFLIGNPEMANRYVPPSGYEELARRFLENFQKLQVFNATVKVHTHTYYQSYNYA